MGESSAQGLLGAKGGLWQGRDRGGAWAGCRGCAPPLSCDPGRKDGQSLAFSPRWDPVLRQLWALAGDTAFLLPPGGVRVTGGQGWWAEPGRRLNPQGWASIPRDGWGQAASGAPMRSLSPIVTQPLGLCPELPWAPEGDRAVSWCPQQACPALPNPGCRPASSAGRGTQVGSGHMHVTGFQQLFKSKIIYYQSNVA